MDGIPSKPGVYLMKNGKNEIIYIGKARNLKKRIRSYYTGTKDVKTRFLVQKIHDIDYIITDTEYEALILENNLIKKWKPHYNINLKDGKTYPLIRVTSEDYPRVFRTRRMIRDGSEYFGPYPHVQSIDRYLELIDKLFPLRKCKGKLKTRKHPCLYFHIGRCAGPCCGKISREEYLQRVAQIKRFLSGETGEIISDLTVRMHQLSQNLEFEQAAEVRDTLEAVRIIAAEQKVEVFEEDVRNYITFSGKENRYVFTVFQIQKGKLFGNDMFRSEIWTDSEEEILTQFLMRYYSTVHEPPDKIFVEVPADYSILEEYFLKNTEKKVHIICPQGGKEKSILNLARENGAQELELWNRKSEQDDFLKEVKAVLKLPGLPRRIEGFDIAQLAGKHPVASMVSFYNGQPDKKNYRRFHVKSLDGEVDDYESIREVIARRYTRILNEGKERPDLILVDGGKGQVSAALGVLKALGLQDVPLLGLAKKEEEIFSPGSSAPLRLPESSRVLKLLQHVRDEAHRFATTFNRKLRERSVGLGLLEKIPGIGPKRSALMLETYGSLEEIGKQSSDDLAALLKISKEGAAGILKKLQSI